MRIVNRPCGNHEAIAGLYLERRLAIDQDFALPFDDIGDLFAGMGVASRGSPWRNDDARDYRLVPSGDVLRLDYSPLNARVLGKQRTHGNDTQNSPLTD